MSTTTASASRSRLEPTRWLVLLASVVAGFAIWIFQHDYSWGSGDQDEFVPYLLHLLDGELLSADWFVGTQTSQIGVRTYFVLLLRVLCIVVPVHIAVALLFVGSWVAIAVAIDRLTRAAGGGSLASATAILTALCLTPKWTLGGNDLVYTMLVPETVAWALALPAMLAFYRHRYVTSGVLLGIACWFQPLVGILVAGMLATTVLVTKRNRNGWRHAIALSSVAAVLALPILVPIGLQTIAGNATADADPSILFILTRFRAPHHYIPSVFSLGSWARMALLLGMAASAHVYDRRRSQVRPMPPMPPMLTILLVIAGMCVVSWFFTAVFPVGIIIKLQVFKLTVIAKLLLIILTATSAESLFFGSTRLQERFAERTLILVALAVVFVSMMIPTLSGKGSTGYGALWDPEPGSGLDEWARTATHSNAVFAVPPTVSSFRSRGRRSIVVNYAAVPFAADDMLEWYDRMRTLAPVDRPLRGQRFRQQLDSSYHARSENKWAEVARTYRVDYLVYRRSASPDMPYDVAYQDAAWVVYRLDTDIDARDQ